MRHHSGILLAFSLMAFSLPLCAQSWKEVKADADRYIWAEGWGSSVKEADKEALTALAGRISLTIVSEFRSVEGQTSSGRGTSRYSSIDHCLRSFSSVSLQNSGMEILENGKNSSHVVRWISREDADRLLGQRSGHVREYVRAAIKSEDEGRFSEALRGYFRAYALVRTFPELSLSPFVDETGDSHTLSIWLPQRIDRLLSDLRVTVSGLSERQATLSFSFRGSPAHGVAFTFFDGCRWSGPVSSADGRKTISLSYNTRPEYLHLKVDCLFLDSAKADRELEYALSTIREEPVQRAYYSCRSSGR